MTEKSALKNTLINVPRLISAYYLKQPNITIKSQQISFGTSGHRGSSLKNSFNENHLLAIAQAICDYRAENGISGPLFLGMDTHALSEPSFATTLEVLAANGVDTMIAKDSDYTPTPVISHAILTHNKNKKSRIADGIVITPSHNPPEDGGFKYNPPHGGPADTAVTQWIENRANKFLEENNKKVRRILYEKALLAKTTHIYDYVKHYVEDLKSAIDIDVIRSAGLKIGVDPMGGAAIHFWEPIEKKYTLKIDMVNRTIDPTFSFMPLDKDGKIRMDCSSPFAMARLISLKDKYDIAFGNDPDVDRHGIVTHSEGLMNPNQYLSVAICYLFQNRPLWKANTAIGKTLVSSSMIDRVAKYLRKNLSEVPVGFKWFVDGLLSGSYGFCGEESAGASFLRKDGTVWTTDKDGIIMDLLAAEITAKTGRDPAEQYQSLIEMFGNPIYERIDVAATAAQKSVLKNLSSNQIEATTLAGEKILAKLTKAPGNGIEIGGIKIVTANGWFAARPSGTEDIYKIYTESFTDKTHLLQIQAEAKKIINTIFASAGL
ncbi:MAG: alpha-D-glucose phosphate-specific phosphoglucomutase [Desulfobacterales bacterium]|nr:alpha-D-glucose phosphate-specific phosphoglucomutase [Desulfobacterales bacterium]